MNGFLIAEKYQKLRHQCKKWQAIYVNFIALAFNELLHGEHPHG